MKKIAVMKMKIVICVICAVEIVNAAVETVKNAIVMKIVTVRKTMEIMAVVMNIQMEIVDVLKMESVIVMKIAIVVIWAEIVAMKGKMKIVVMKEKVEIAKNR